MSIENSISEADVFAALDRNEFAQLTTYRKSGVGVPTTIWFAHTAGEIYVTTQPGAGKLKRIRNNGRATLAPCTRRGQVTGASIACTARVLSTPAEQGQAIQALTRKYGLLYRLFRGFQRLRGVNSTYIAIQQDQALPAGER